MSGQTDPVPGVALRIDPRDNRPKHQQIEHALRTAIRAGRLQAGSALPSSRALSTDLGVSRGVVTSAYDQLAAEGYLVVRQGASTRVSDAIRGAAVRPSARSLARGFTYDLRPGLPDLAGFPWRAWHRAMARAWSAAPASVLGELDPRGVPAFRDALASYLDRARGTAADPELLVGCAGVTQGLSLVCRWLRMYGVEEIAVEDPGWHPHRLTIQQAGSRAVGIPVDAHGIDVDAVSASGVAAVVVTPAHHFPTGAVLSPDRRRALLDWAESTDALIIEDDYDSELRYDRTAVGALQGLAPERVLHLGSMSKRLAPGLRLGWALAPSWLTWPLIETKAVEDGGSEVLGQLALADFVASGELERHLRRMRAEYSKRRRDLIAMVAEHLPGVCPGEDPAGLHELLILPEGVDEAGVVAAAARRGVGVEGLDLHRHDRSGAAGLLVGYGATPSAPLERAIELLGEALADADRPSQRAA